MRSTIDILHSSNSRNSRIIEFASKLKKRKVRNIDRLKLVADYCHKTHI